jgi:hypothetical protein
LITFYHDRNLQIKFEGPALLRVLAAHPARFCFPKDMHSD